MTPSTARQRHAPRRAVSALTAAVLAGSLAVAADASAAGPPGRVDNPYRGVDAYVNPEWAAQAAAEPGGWQVADQPTAVWLESRADVTGAAGEMGLRAHLDEALAQEAGLIQLVLYNLPGRDCGRLVSHGELAPDELDVYKTEFIDPIAETLADPAYAELRVVVVVEPRALADLVVHTAPRPWSTPACDEMLANGNYVQGIGYALDELGDLPQVYPYLDASHHGVLGWSDSRLPAADLVVEAATAEGAKLRDVHGIAVNTADYSVLHEDYFDIDDTVNGTPVIQSRWVDWNDSIEELSYGEMMREELVAKGFHPGIGVIIDTSRNGWGGPDRPEGPSTAWDVNTFVDESRLDRRISVGNWCNQAGSGLGERPTADPVAGVDAYTWIKPPGESDGADAFGLPWPQDWMCDPDYLPITDIPTGALPDAPPAGEWFPAHFQELLRNAWPPL